MFYTCYSIQNKINLNRALNNQYESPRIFKQIIYIRIFQAYTIL